MGGTSANTATTTSRRDSVRARPMLRTGDRHGGTTILAVETLSLCRGGRPLSDTHPQASGGSRHSAFFTNTVHFQTAIHGDRFSCGQKSRARRPALY
jgi:hypothetical protein